MITKVKQCLGAFLFYLFSVFPIKKNKVVINMNDGKGFGENGKYIVEELLRRKKNIDIVWLSRYKRDVFPEKIRSVSYFSLLAIYEQATAKIWIGNKRKPGYVRKRKSQYYIMTWHAGISLKKVEADAEKALSKVYIDAAKRDSKMIDLFLSSSKWDTDCYRRAFWYDGEILECGYPRQDILFNVTNNEVQRIKKQFGIDEHTKIFLYAPTFRKEMTKDTFDVDLSVYNIDYSNVCLCLEERFGGKWIPMIRLHPNISKYSDILELPPNVYDVSNYSNVQDLLMCADCLITDYSSTIFDYAIMKKPAFIFALDYQNYKKDRDLYFDLNELPFPFSQSKEELANEIRIFDEAKYKKSLDYFYYEKCGLQQGGNASGRVCDRIEKVLDIEN